MKRKRYRLKKKLIILRLLTLIFIIGIIYNSTRLINYESDLKENNKIQINLNEYIDKDRVEFDELKKQNKDTVAFIKVNNTRIHYVVVKGKDNDFYLNHNFNKEKNIAGWIFGDFRNNFDETDRNLIIYGHNMKDGSMFDTLIKTIDKEWYTNKDNYIVKLITEKGSYKYKVFSTYSVRAEDYYINTGFNNDKEFDKFVNTLKDRSVYNYDTEVNGTDKILTLSSCIGDGRKRVVLHAKLIEKEEN